MKLVCCDIGNTRIKIGLYENDSLISVSSFPSLSETKDYLLEQHPHNAAVSSVVPKSSELLFDLLVKELKLTPFMIDLDKKFRLKIDYDTPETLGIDRICASEGAYKLYTDNYPLRRNEVLITADLGTASTVNVIEYPGVFAGGLIAPGPGLLFKGMKLHTAQLPESSFQDFYTFTGKSTKGCIASGVKNSVSGFIEKVYKKISEQSRIASFYITGGNALHFLDDFNFSFEYKPDLIITGIKAVYDYNLK